MAIPRWYSGVLLFLLVCWVRPAAGKALPSPHRPGGNADSSEVVARPDPVDGDSLGSNFWTLPADATELCPGQRPLFRFLGTDFRAFPLPIYQEEHGWDIGGIITAEFHQRFTVGTVLSWTERSGELAGRVLASGEIGAIRQAEATARFEWFSRIGRRGVLGGIDFLLSIPDERGHVNLSTIAATYSVSSLDYLSIRDWETGDVTEVIVGFEGERLPDSTGDGSHIGWLLQGVFAGRALGGDYGYRRVLARVHWARGEWEAHALAGISDGHLPVQHLYDAGVEGLVMGIPIRKFRGSGLRSLNLERRQKLFSEFFGRVFGVVAAADGIDGLLNEWGVSLTVEDPESPIYIGGMLFRLDFPVFSSHADRHGGARHKWDLRRLGFRFVFPWLPFTGREEETRYRYPGR